MDLSIFKYGWHKGGYRVMIEQYVSKDPNMALRPGLAVVLMGYSGAGKTYYARKLGLEPFKWSEYTIKRQVCQLFSLEPTRENQELVKSLTFNSPGSTLHGLTGLQIMIGAFNETEQHRNTWYEIGWQETLSQLRRARLQGAVAFDDTRKLEEANTILTLFDTVWLYWLSREGAVLKESDRNQARIFHALADSPKTKQIVYRRS